MKYQFDPICEEFPAMLPEEFAGLVESIKKNGQLEPCLRYGGKIFDGKHRCLAAIEAGHEPIIRDWNPKAHDPKFVEAEMRMVARARNLDRRHLSASQKAILVAKDVTTKGKGRPELNGNQFPITQEDAAQVAGVSRKTVNQAVAVLESGTAEIIEAVQSGKVSVKDAAAVVSLPPKEQKAAVKKVGEKKAPTLKKAAGPQTAAAVKSNGKATVKGKEIITPQVEKAFGVVTRLIDQQAKDCGLLNTSSHRVVTAHLNEALKAFGEFTKECSREISRR